MVLKTLLSMHR